MVFKGINIRKFPEKIIRRQEVDKNLFKKRKKKETKQETEQTLDKVIHDRKFLVDAAIVRTMKARTKLAYNDLVSEVIRLVRFPLDISLMKQRIEDLIDKDYMCREAKELGVFHYVA